MQQLPHLDDALSALLHDSRPAHEADELRRASEELALLDRMPIGQTAIFEGAQGLLLDEWKGFHPYTTWSTVTPYHALEIIEDNDISDYSVLGVTRAYSTRHGAGPFPTRSRDLSDQMTDPGNPTNDWQGSIHFGSLDIVLLNYAAEVGGIDGIAVTCHDQIRQRTRLCTAYETTDRIDVPRTLEQQSQLATMLQSATPLFVEATIDDILSAISKVAPIMMTAAGPSSGHRQRITDIFGTKTIRKLPPRTISPIFGSCNKIHPQGVACHVAGRPREEEAEPNPTSAAHVQ